MDGEVITAISQVGLEDAAASAAQADEEVAGAVTVAVTIPVMRTRDRDLDHALHRPVAITLKVRLETDQLTTLAEVVDMGEEDTETEEHGDTMADVDLLPSEDQEAQEEWVGLI